MVIMFKLCLLMITLSCNENVCFNVNLSCYSGEFWNEHIWFNVILSNIDPELITAHFHQNFPLDHAKFTLNQVMMTFRRMSQSIRPFHILMIFMFYVSPLLCLFAHTNKSVLKDILQVLFISSHIILRLGPITQGL